MALQTKHHGLTLGKLIVTYHFLLQCLKFRSDVVGVTVAMVTVESSTNIGDGVSIASYEASVSRME